MLKLCFLFSLTVMVFLLQMYCQNAQPKSDIAILLDVLKKIVDESIQRAKPTIDAYAAKVESTAGSVENEAEAAMKFTRDGFRDQLDVYKEMAADAGVSIDDCLMGKEEKLMNMPHEYFVGLLRNVSHMVVEGITCAVHALENINNINNDIADIEQEIVDCETDVSSTDCLEKLETKIEESIVSLPKKINKYIRTAQTLTEEACTGIEEYASETSKDLENEGGKILATIFECAEKIIN